PDGLSRSSADVDGHLPAGVPGMSSRRDDHRRTVLARSLCGAREPGYLAMIISTDHHRTIRELGSTESRWSCLPVPIRSPVTTPTLPITSWATASHVYQLHRNVLIGGRSVPLSALPRGRTSFNPHSRTPLQRLSPKHPLPTVAADKHLPAFRPICAAAGQKM